MSFIIYVNDFIIYYNFWFCGKKKKKKKLDSYNVNSSCKLNIILLKYNL